MKNKLLSLFSNTIPYIKELRSITDSVTAAILMQQLDYWFAKTGNKKAFYKYKEPPKSDARFYKKGDSWIEELGFSAEEFDSAWKKIGVSYNTKTDYKDALAEGTVFINPHGEQKYYARYTDRKLGGVSFYYRNNQLLDKLLDDLLVLDDEDDDTQTDNHGTLETDNHGLGIPTQTDMYGFLETVNDGIPCTESTVQKNTNTENTDKIAEAIAPQGKNQAITVQERSFMLDLSFPEKLAHLYQLSKSESDVLEIPPNYKLDFGFSVRGRKMNNLIRDRLFLLSAYLMNMPVKRTESGREAAAITKLEMAVKIGTYTEQDIYGCALWATTTGKFDIDGDGYAESILSIVKLIGKFKRANENGKLSFDRKPTYENNAQREDRIRKERNDEQISEEVVRRLKARGLRPVL